jgi:predicted neutral ceramidase superfamily lipid hydrolase
MVNVATDDSLNHSMKSALKHYSSMFFLPAFQKSVAILAALCIGGVGLSTFTLFFSVDKMVSSLLLGVSVFAAVLFGDYIISKVILGGDAIYVLRRTVALSLFCWVLWLFFIILGAAFGIFFGWLWWIKLCLLGFAAVTTFRAVVFISTSSVGFLQRTIASLLSPLLCIVPFTIFWSGIDSAIPLQFLPYLVISIIAGCSFAFLFVFLVDQVGRRTYGVPSMPLFRAFMLNWVAALNAPFETLLEKLGENEDIEVTLLKFDSYKPKAAIIVPLVHPGPFKNIGSSLLPSMLKRDFEKQFNCDTCVPLGILGHELDLA